MKNEQDESLEREAYEESNAITPNMPAPAGIYDATHKSPDAVTILARELFPLWSHPLHNAAYRDGERKLRQAMTADQTRIHKLEQCLRDYEGIQTRLSIPEWEAQRRAALNG